MNSHHYLLSYIWTFRSHLLIAFVVFIQIKVGFWFWFGLREITGDILVPNHSFLCAIIYIIYLGVNYLYTHLAESGSKISKRGLNKNTLNKFERPII